MDQDTNATTKILVCNDENLLYTALNRYIKLKTLLRKTYGTDIVFAGIAIDEGTVVNVRCDNDLFDCGVELGNLDDFISSYEKAPFIEEKDNDDSPECNLTGLYKCTRNDQENYVRGMIYDSAEWFFRYQNHQPDNLGPQTKAKLQRSFRKLFQSLNLLRVEYDLEPKEEKDQKNSNKRPRHSEPYRIVQERITESLSALFLETAPLTHIETLFLETAPLSILPRSS